MSQVKTKSTPMVLASLAFFGYGIELHGTFITSAQIQINTFVKLFFMYKTRTKYYKS
jgi:hypothetical protein